MEVAEITIYLLTCSFVGPEQMNILTKKAPTKMPMRKMMRAEQMKNKCWYLVLRDWKDISLILLIKLGLRLVLGGK